jgi:hypothetical protein
LDLERRNFETLCLLEASFPPLWHTSWGKYGSLAHLTFIRCFHMRGYMDSWNHWYITGNF